MPSRPLRHLPILMLLLALMGLSGFAAHRIAQQLGLAELQTTGLHRLDLYTASLEREIGKYAFLPGTLGLERDVLALLGQADDGKMAHQVNVYLEQLNDRAGTLSIYVINTAGEGRCLKQLAPRRQLSSAKTFPSAPIFARRWPVAAAASSASARHAGSPATTSPRRCKRREPDAGRRRHQGQPRAAGEIVEHGRGAGPWLPTRTASSFSARSPTGNSPRCARSTRQHAAPSTRRSSTTGAL